MVQGQIWQLLVVVGNMLGNSSTGGGGNRYVFLNVIVIANYESGKYQSIGELIKDRIIGKRNLS